MIGVVVGEMVDRSDLVAAALSQDVLTVFQFHSYILQHEVQDMETHLLHLAREGEKIDFVQTFTKTLDAPRIILHLNLWHACVFVSFSDVFAEALCSGDYSQCLAEMDSVPVSSLWPRNSTLRALASLLTAEDPQVNKAAAEYLSSGASRSHFRTRVSSTEECLRDLCVCVSV